MIYDVTAYGAVLDGVTDNSAAVQTAINTAEGNGGGIVFFPAGVCLAKELSWPNNVTLSGCGKGVSVVKLPNDANTFIVASANYLNNLPFVNVNQSAEKLTFDGNKQEQNSGFASAVISRSFRASFHQCQMVNSRGHGLLFTTKMSNGGGSVNGAAESVAAFCDCTDNSGAGIYGENDSNFRLADTFISHCNLAANGLNSNLRNIHIERGAGWKILNNQCYGNPNGNLTVEAGGMMNVIGNQFDGSAGNDGYTNIWFELAGYGQLAFTGNYMFDVRDTAPIQVTHIRLRNMGANFLSPTISANSFGFKNISGPNARHIIGEFFPVNAKVPLVGNSFWPLMPTPLPFPFVNS